MTDLNSIALQYAQALKQQLIQDKKTATGQLVASIKCEAKIEEKYYSIAHSRIAEVNTCEA